MLEQMVLKKEKSLWKYLFPNLCVFPFMIAIFLLVYKVDVKSFVNLSKITIFCMAFYLIINAINTRMISSNLFISSVSLFYGAINLLQVSHVVFAQFFNLAPAAPGLSVKTYFLGRNFFIVAFIILVLLYKHKRQWIIRYTSIACLVLILLACWVFTINSTVALAFINGPSFWAKFLTIGDKFFMISALLFGIWYLRDLLPQFPKSQLVIFSCFLACAFTMETLNIIHFLPFGTTKGPLMPHLFKLTTLYIFIVGQIDCCFLRPFANLYINAYHTDKKAHDAVQELYRYSDYVVELEQTLATKASSIHQLINIFPEPVLICHQDRILNANLAALRLLDATHNSQLETSSILNYIHDSSSELTAYLETLKLDANETFSSEGTLISLTGQRYDIEYILTSTSLFDSHSTICIMRDVSAKKISELAEKHLHEKEFKLSYFSNLSHDLKAPLNIIYSALQMQEKSHDLQDLHHYTYMMQQNTLKLLRMLTNLLDMNKVSQNALTLKPQTFNIVDKFEEICEMSQSYIEAHQLTYVFDTSIEERMVHIDIQIFERIVLNLISNAIKYTPDGGSLAFEITDTPHAISLHIKDTGVGMDTAFIPHIFERFKTGDSHSSGEHTYDKSYGMGLPIVQELVKLLEGSITCSSVLGEGSEFVVTLPTPPLEVDETSFIPSDFASLNLKMEFYDI